MNNISLLQKTLGNDWDKLPSVIKRHYRVSIDSNTCLKGNMEIGYPNFLLPLIYLIHLCGGLVSRRGKNIATLVEKTVKEENTALCWKRTLFSPNDRHEYFYSKMVYLQDHELIAAIQSIHLYPQIKYSNFLLDKLLTSP